MGANVNDSLSSLGEKDDIEANALTQLVFDCVNDRAADMDTYALGYD